MGDHAGDPVPDPTGADASAAAPPDLPLRVVRLHLEDLPPLELPTGFAIRDHQPGDDETWTDIQREAERSLRIDGDTFAREFGDDQQRLGDRCLFLVNEGGDSVGTITAWERPFLHSGLRGATAGDLRAVLAARHAAHADPWGLPCWLALRPAYQARSLSGPLLAAALHRLARLDHSRCFGLTTTRRTAVIRRVLRYGFQPDLEGAEARDAWRAALAVDPTLPAFGVLDEDPVDGEG